jgi:mannose-6-phosphate isomerase class I
LHVEKAADVLDFHVSTASALRPLAYNLHGLRRSTLVAESHFIVERILLDDERRGLDLDGSPLTITALADAVELETRGTAVRLEPYQTAVIPAALETVMLRSIGENATILTAEPPSDPEVIERRFSRAAVPVADSTAFLAQF